MKQLLESNVATVIECLEAQIVPLGTQAAVTSLVINLPKPLGIHF